MRSAIRHRWFSRAERVSYEWRVSVRPPNGFIVCQSVRTYVFKVSIFLKNYWLSKQSAVKLHVEQANLTLTGQPRY